MGKFSKLFLRFWPIGFILVVWIIFSSPYFFQQKVPYPAKYQVTFFSPWSHYPEFAGPVKNNAMPDVIDQIYPWKYFTIQSLKNGQIPFWNPYNFAGNPHVANFQSAVFSPFNLLFFILPFIDAWSMLVLLQVIVAGIGMYLLMREFAVSKIGSLISSISFMFCGFIVVWLAYGILSMAIAILPLILFAIERAFNKKTVWAFPLIAVGLATSFFSGHIQTSFYLSIFSVLYVVFKVIVTKDIGRFIFVSLFFALGIAVSLVQILPTLELYSQSVRNNLIAQGGEIPFHYLVTVFAPDFYGNPVTRNDWVGYYAEWASFIGIIPLILGIFALIKPKKLQVYFFAIIGFLALLFSSDTPFRQLLAVSGIPIFATSIPSRMIVLFSFSFAVLSGFGLDNLQKSIEKNYKKRIIVLLSILSLLLIGLWLSLIIFNILPQDKSILAKRNLVLPTLLFIGFAFLVFINLFKKHKKIPRVLAKLPLITILGLCLLLFTAFDSLRFASKWMPFDNRALVYPDTQVVKELKKIIGNDRVFGNLGTQVESYYGIQSLEGYDPLYLMRYGEFTRSSSGEFLEAERSVVQVASDSKYTERVLDLLGVSIIFHPKADTFQSWAFPVWADKGKYVPVYEDEKFQLFKNTTAMSRAELFYNYEVERDGKKLLERFYSKDFDFRKVLLLEDDPQIPICLPSTNPVCEGKAEITSYTPNKVIVSVTSNHPSLLFLSDNFYKNWKVKVNSKEEKIYRADYAFRAVKVPTGKSIIEFYYSGLF